MARRFRLKQLRPFIAVATIFFFSCSLVLPTAVFGQAKSKPKVAILGFQPTTTAMEEEVLEGLSAYLAGRQDIDVVPVASVKSFVTKQELKQNSKARQAIRKGEKFYKQGKASYEVLKINEAIGHFEAALKSFEQSIEFMESNKVLLTTYLYLGMSKILVKRKKEGRQDIRKMIVLDSKRDKRRLSKKFFPPDIIKTYGALKKDVQSKANGQVKITSTPSGGRVLIDGLRVGQTPYEVSGMSAGEHTITVYKRGYDRWSKAVKIKAGDNNISAKLERAAVFAPVDPERDPFGLDRELLKQAADDIDADIFVLAVAEDGRKGGLSVKGQLYSVRSGDLGALESLQVENDGVAKQRGFRFGKELLRSLDSRGKVIAQIGGKKTKKKKRSKDQGKPNDDSFTALPGGGDDFQDFKGSAVASDSSPFYKKWWFWAIVGGAVVAGGASLFLFTDTFNSGSGGNVLVIDNPGVP